MRPSVQKIEPPSWKEEVNRRIAEHNGRKGQPLLAQAPSASSHPAETASAKAAARVAARYAKVPSYSELRAEEARAAVRAAEAASRAALEAQAAAESVLAGLEADIEASLISESESSSSRLQAPLLVNPHANSAQSEFITGAATGEDLAPSHVQASESRASSLPSHPAPSYAIRWDGDLPARPAAGARATRGPSIYEVPVDSAWQSSQDAHDPQNFAVVEAAQPIHANLIRFPRELVATRKVRSRLSENVQSAAGNTLSQLSIFEVEPWAVAPEPGTPNAIAAVAPQTWSGRDYPRDYAGADWAGIQLDPEPHRPFTSAVHAPSERVKSAAAPQSIDLAPVSQRLMATLVDFSLIMTAFLAAGFVAFLNSKTLPSMRAVEIGSAIGISIVALLYQAFFFTLAESTPGMRYAGLRLCTLSGETLSLTQKYRRAVALVVSMMPAGIGVLSAVIDQQFLCWHDRFSGTYLRRG